MNKSDQNQCRKKLFLKDIFIKEQLMRCTLGKLCNLAVFLTQYKDILNLEGHQNRIIG